ncbi:MAG: DUF305 domain-containing protein [Gemmatimonadetes bacterium]|nr:DUF305 domain-containing protein [Gemmatimonadota bacterium]
MKAPSMRRTVAALFLFACVAATTDAGVATAQQDNVARQATLSPSEYEAVYRARTDSARMRFTEADVEFVTGMIGHHAQALIMSDLAPKNGASPQVQTLAARIINAQKDEIALMQQWLRDRGQPVPMVKIDGLHLMIDMSGPDGQMKHDMHDMHSGQGHMMPGMLTQAELEELAASFGPEFDRLFLTGMIAHHGGAVTMVHELFAVDGAGQDEAVFKLASDVQVDQLTEIARMELMLEQYTD